MTKLSVNINKAATLRNARGGNNPDILTFAHNAEIFGAQGITVHPRPDERHIRYDDVRTLSKHLQTDFNIEGYPSTDFQNLVCEVCPQQVTLVPDAPDQLTSNAGWDTLRHADFLRPIVERFQSKGIRVSLFVDPLEEMIKGAKRLNADRIELYTFNYANDYAKNPHHAIEPYVKAANYAKTLDLGINAGHDLNLQNLSFFHHNIPFLHEVSIGHALICDALYMGMQNTIETYRKALLP